MTLHSFGHRLRLGGMLLVACMFFTVRPVIAQTAGTGALTGAVMDATGAVVPDASVTVTSEGGQVRTATTNSDGAYSIGLLPPGPYRVKFDAAGFKTAEIPSAVINVTQTAVLNCTLQVGAQTQEVTVQDSVEAVQTASSAMGTVVGGTASTALPLSTRNYTNLLALSAGAAADVNNATTLGKGGTAISVNGNGASNNTYLQDGVAVNNWWSQGTPNEGGTLGAFAIPNPDAISEFVIQTSTYDAGYGRNPGANVNVVTKSGTNDYHGTAFEFFRNTVLNANDFFRNFTDGSRLVLNANQYGGVFGGPVKKDRLFFFVSYQGTAQKNGISAAGYSVVTLAPIPTGDRGTCPVGWTLLSQCNGAAQTFVPALGAAVCPTNHPTNGNDKTVAGGIQVLCDGSNINPVAVNLLQLKLGANYLVPSSGSATGAYLPQTFADPAIFHDHQGIGNWDYVIDSRNTLSGRYEYDADPTLQNFPTVGSAFLLGNPVTTEQSDQAAVLKLTSIVTSHLVNEARVSYQRYVINNTEPGSLTNSEVGITNLTPGIDNLTNISVGSLFTFGYQISFDAYVYTNQYEAADQISWTKGRQTIRAGFEIQRIMNDQATRSTSFGHATFGSFPDFLLGRASCAPGTFGNGAGQCNVNNPGGTNGTAATSNVAAEGGMSGGGFPFYNRVWGGNAFVQDDFRVNSRLTLNLGLRWEYDGFITEANGNQADLWPGLVNLVPIPGGTPATGTLTGFALPNNYKGPLPAGLFKNNSPFLSQTTPPLDNFAPRVGFAWQPTGSDRWVLRGGAGYFYDFIVAINTINTLTPGVGAPSTGAGGATLSNPWVIPPGVVPGAPGTFGFTPRWLNLATGASSNLTDVGIGQHWNVPLVYQWNLNTQWEFRPTWVLEVGYVGSRGIHQTTTLSGTGYPFNVAPLYSPGSPDPLTGVTTNTAQNATLRAPLLGVSTQAVQPQTVNGFNFNSLQATVRKQMSHGLQFQAAYTWSHAASGIPYGINAFPYTVVAYGLNTTYRPQRLVVNYVWNLPGNHEGLTGKLADGWSVSGVTVVQNGYPVTITDSRGGKVFGAPAALSTAQFCPGMGVGNVATSGSAYQRVVSGLTGGPGWYNGTKQGVFCAPPAIGTDGSSGFGDAGLGLPVLGPGQNNWDMSIAKITTVGGIRENATLQFRAEFFNTFNHPQFALPVAAANSGAFGQVTTSSVNPRLIQFALKYAF